MLLRAVLADDASSASHSDDGVVVCPYVYAIHIMHTHIDTQNTLAHTFALEYVGMMACVAG